MAAWSQPSGMMAAARTISKWRSAIASRMPPRSIKWGSTFDSFSRSGCLTTGMISNGSRLAMVREACARDLEAIPFLLNRGLYFQAFDRLYKAFQEFLQALFVARRIYP